MPSSSRRTPPPGILAASALDSLVIDGAARRHKGETVRQELETAFRARAPVFLNEPSALCDSLYEMQSWLAVYRLLALECDGWLMVATQRAGDLVGTVPVAGKHHRSFAGIPRIVLDAPGGFAWRG